MLQKSTPIVPSTNINPNARSFPEMIGETKLIQEETNRLIRETNKIINDFAIETAKAEKTSQRLVVATFIVAALTLIFTIIGIFR